MLSSQHPCLKQMALATLSDLPKVTKLVSGKSRVPKLFLLFQWPDLKVNGNH